MNLERFLYEFNLVSTNMAKDIYQFCEMLNSSEVLNIDISNSISLKNIIKVFNEAYLAFLKDYRKLPSLSLLGEDVSINYIALSEMGDYLLLNVYKPRNDLFDEDYAIVNFNGNNDIVIGYIANRLFGRGPNYKCKDLALDKEVIKCYLDLVRKHHLFLNCYLDFKNKFVFGNGTSSLITEIKGNLLKSLEYFNFYFGNFYLNHDYLAYVCFNLGPKDDVAFVNSSIMVDDVALKEQGQNIQRLADSVYLSKNFLPELFSQENEMLVRR